MSTVAIYLHPIRRLTERWVELVIKLTKVKVEYTVSAINRDSRMISKKNSFRSPFPFIRGYAASVRVALFYVSKIF
jgi:hypothetical protein